MTDTQAVESVCNCDHPSVRRTDGSVRSWHRWSCPLADPLADIKATVARGREEMGLAVPDVLIHDHRPGYPCPVGGYVRPRAFWMSPQDKRWTIGEEREFCEANRATFQATLRATVEDMTSTEPDEAAPESETTPEAPKGVVAKMDVQFPELDTFVLLMGWQFKDPKTILNVNRILAEGEAGRLFFKSMADDLLEEFEAWVNAAHEPGGQFG